MTALDSGDSVPFLSPPFPDTTVLLSSPLSLLQNAMRSTATTANTRTHPPTAMARMAASLSRTRLFAVAPPAAGGASEGGGSTGGNTGAGRVTLFPANAASANRSKEVGTGPSKWLLERLRNWSAGRPRSGTWPESELLERLSARSWVRLERATGSVPSKPLKERSSTWRLRSRASPCGSAPEKAFRWRWSPVSAARPRRSSGNGPERLLARRLSTCSAVRRPSVRGGTGPERPSPGRRSATTREPSALQVTPVQAAQTRGVEAQLMRARPPRPTAARKSSSAALSPSGSEEASQRQLSRSAATQSGSRGGMVVDWWWGSACWI
uniref:Uncharacterized protein n=1 Tax=Arundo donax TaxID=35708 RepID=A0A0A9DX72_ARUDO